VYVADVVELPDLVREPDEERRDVPSTVREDPNDGPRVGEALQLRKDGEPVLLGRHRDKERERERHVAEVPCQLVREVYVEDVSHHARGSLRWH